jgi:hypothetical protein
MEFAVVMVNASGEITDLWRRWSLSLCSNPFSFLFSLFCSYCFKDGGLFLLLLNWRRFLMVVCGGWRGWIWCLWCLIVGVVVVVNITMVSWLVVTMVMFCGSGDGVLMCGGW